MEKLKQLLKFPPFHKQNWYNSRRSDSFNSLGVFFPCGKFLAAASFDATIIIYERNKSSNEFEELHKLEGHECEVKCCSFSISGHYLATCSRDKTVWIWKGLNLVF
uniref:Uncharacterized protein n=1 Tax=Meloidogyne enterolobii TaxID=390850 RepID=A0A6V7UJT6_MELEN|nr:unnamed protein product [Meloidogyne enterolobii]